jgi:hypothetical protein
MQQFSRVIRSSWRSPQHRWLWIINSLMIGALVLWLLVANRASRVGDVAIQNSWNDFVQPFLQQQNEAATRVDQVQANLDLETIQQPLAEYFNRQIKQSTDVIEPVPDVLKHYLSQKNSQISALKTYLLTSEVPYWKIDYLSTNKIPDYTTALPSFLNIINLQRVLLLTVIEQDRLEQSEPVLDGLTASWKLTQAISARPELISSLVTIISINLHAGVLRQLDHLPTNWQTQLPLPDLKKSMLTALEMESFAGAETFRTYLSVELETLKDMGVDSPRSPFLRLQRVFHQPYLNLASIDYFQTMQRSLKYLSQQDLCTLDTNSILDNANATPAWWNSLSWQIPSFFNQFQKITKALLQWELTQKVLEIKALESQTTRPPQTIPGINASAVCPNLSWTYQVATDGTATIALPNLPKGLTLGENDLSLSYSL